MRIPPILVRFWIGELPSHPSLQQQFCQIVQGAHHGWVAVVFAPGTPKAAPRDAESSWLLDVSWNGGQFDAVADEVSDKQATWGWWDECVDEAYAILPQEAKDPDFAPGFNIAQLQADLAAVAN